MSHLGDRAWVILSDLLPYQTMMLFFSERNDPCFGSTMIRTVLTNADGSPSVRMVGEIAAQLERRILVYVFSGTDRKSDYGIQVRNIPEAIEETCLDRNTGKVNIALRFRLIKRCAFVKTSVRPFGYRFDFHPQFAIDLVISIHVLVSQ